MPRPVYKGFRGPYLRTLREQRGWTQEQLAVHVNSFPSMVGKWERGEVTPGAASVAKLAVVFDVAPQDFSEADPTKSSIVELRVRAGLTRAQAAAAAGISVRRLRQYEHYSCRPSDGHADRLSRIYDVPAELLLTSWDRDRAQAFPGVPPAGQAC